MSGCGDRLRGTVFFILIVMVSAASANECKTYSSGLAFMGQSEGAWQLYRSSDGELPEQVDTNVEPRGFAYHSGKDAFVYIGIDGSAYYREGASEEIIDMPTNDSAYTQPEFGPSGETVYFVEMKNRNSKETDVVSWDLKDEVLEKVVAQRSAQFEPHVTQGTLVYSNVHCVEACGRIIQEIWKKDTISGVARQLTLMGGISKQPVLSSGGEKLYFSSNRGGGYSVWVYEMETGNKRKLTEGSGVDLYPAEGKNGSVLFIRRQANQVELMCKAPGKAPQAMPLPDSVTDLRELKVSG